MLKQTPQRREPARSAHRIQAVRVLFAVFGVFCRLAEYARLTGVVFYTRTRASLSAKFTVKAVSSIVAVVALTGTLGVQLLQATEVIAAPANTVNFQARLETAAGAVSPDGDYNIRFKLYGTSSGGSALWSESYLVSNASGIRTANGYLSANLGSSVDFTSNINWGQQLYLTMEIGGTSSTPVWDGEMDPRLPLTSVPSAFALNSYNSVTGYTGSLRVAQPTGGNQEFVVPDQGAAGTYTLLTTNTANTGFIQNQNVAAQASTNFFVSGDGKAATSLQAPLIDSISAGTLSIGTTNATSITIGKAGVLTTVAGSLTVAAGGTFTNAGSTVLTAVPLSLGSSGVIGSNTATVDVATNFSITATGTGLSFTLPTPTASSTAGRVIFISNVGVNSFTMYGVQVAAGSTQSFVYNGSSWTVNGVNAAGSFIQNQSASAQSANIFVQGASNTVSAVIQAAGGGSVPAAFQVKSNTGASLLTVGPTGPTTILSTGTSANAVLTLVSSTPTQTVLRLRSSANQSVDYFTVQNSDGTANLSGLNSAGQLYYQSGSFKGTLAQAELSADRTYTLPDASGTVCLNTTCAATLSGTNNYVARFNSSSTLGTGLLYDSGTYAGVNISSQLGSGTFGIQAASSQVGLVVQGTSGQNIADFKNSSGTTVASVNAAGVLTAQGASIALNTSTDGSSAASISVTNQNTAESFNAVSALQVSVNAVLNPGGINTANGIKFNNASGVTGRSYNALYAGTGYNSILNYNGTSIIDGVGKFENEGFASGTTYTNLTSVGALTVVGSLTTKSTTTTSTNSTDLVLGSGNATGSTSNSGSVTLDSGTATGTAGAVNVGTGNASAVNVGNSTGSTALSLQAGTGGVTLGTTNGVANTIQIGATTGTASQIFNLGNNANANNAVTIGSTNAASVTTIQGGSTVNIATGNATNTVQIGAVNSESGSPQIINIGTNANASSSTTLTIGSVAGASSLTLRSGSGGTTVYGALNLFNNGLSTASTLRLGNDGTLQNVKIGTTQGVAITDASGNLSTLGVGSATGKCLGYNGSEFIWTVCSGGSGGGSGSTADSYINGGSDLTSNTLSACGNTATTQIATSYPTNITNPTLGLCSSNTALDIITNNVSRINISGSGDVKVLSNESGGSSERFAVRTYNDGNNAHYFDTLRVDTSTRTGEFNGRVGIGLLSTTAPEVRLDIGGNSTSTGSTSNGGLQMWASGTPGLSHSATNGGGALSSGRIFFDETTGKFKVSENGSAWTNLIQSASPGFTNGGNAFGSVQTLGSTDSQSLKVITNNTERLVIDTSGNFLFKTNGNVDIANAAGSTLLARFDYNNSALLIGTTSGMGGVGLNVLKKINTTDGFSVGGTSGVTNNCGGTYNGLNIKGGIITGGYCAANNSDLAEAYNSTDNLAPGELVMAAGTAATSVSRATAGSAAGRLMGIVSTAPSQTIGTAQVPNGYPIALSGRVPTKVNGEGGPIAIGDKITISSVAGVGKKATSAGLIVGTAVETFNGSGTGTIEVFVNLTYYQPTDLEMIQAQTATFGGLQVSGVADIAELNVLGSALINQLEVTGNTLIQGDLTVVGVTRVASIVVGGHILSQGTAPSVNVGVAAGQQGSVTIDGTDSAGTLTITVKAAEFTGGAIEALTAGSLADVSFNSSYEFTPRIVITPMNAASVAVPVYVVKTATGYQLVINQAAANDVEYQFDYVIVGSNQTVGATF